MLTGQKDPANDTPDQRARGHRVRWLLGILLALGVLVALLAMGSTMSAQSGPVGVLADPWATEFCKPYGMECGVGDFNGDNLADIIQFNRSASPTGEVWVRLKDPLHASFLPPVRWLTNFCGNGEICRVGKFNADPYDDIVAFHRGDANTSNIWVALSNGQDGFYAPSSWLAGFCRTGEVCDVGDYNGDSLSDVAYFTRNYYYTDLTNDNWGKVYVAINNGGGHFNPITNSWKRHFCMSVQPEVCGSADFNRDGKDDIVVFSKNTGTVWVALSQWPTQSFGSSVMWNPRNAKLTPQPFCLGGETCGVGDFNGDGYTDLVTYLRSLYSGKEGDVYVSLYAPPQSPSTLWSDFFCIGNQTCGTGSSIDGLGSSYLQISRSGDFNGDTLDDVVAFVRNTEPTPKPGWVYVNLSNGSGFVDSLPPTVTPTVTQTPTVTPTPTITPTPTVTWTPPGPPVAWLPLIVR